MASVGLVTVLFNSEKVLEGFFRSLSAQTYKDYHLYLVDNTPNDAVRSQLRELLSKFPVPAYTHIENTSNVGVAKGNNQGIELSIAAGCEWTLLLNNDIEFDQPHLLEEMITYSEKNNEHLVIPKILYYDTRKIWMAGGWMRESRGTVFHIGDGQDDGPEFGNIAHYNYAPTCFMLIRNEVFSKVGIMDEKYFVYYDDTDFVYRATQKGYKILYLPSLVVLHKVSSSTGGAESLFTIYYTTRNRIYFIRKNFNLFKKTRALSFMFSTRIFKYLAYDSKRKKELIRALKDGLAMKVTSTKLSAR